jgi:hypothetical protein
VSVHVRDTAKGRRYDVKLRSAGGAQHSKTFATKRAAVEYEARQTAALADGLFIPPERERRVSPPWPNDGLASEPSGSRPELVTGRS